MHFLYGILIFAVAGAMNGSFALPSKYLKNWSFQQIWFHYSVWAFLILPCLFLTILAPTAWKIYANAPVFLLAMILIGGFLFAIGQICFSLSLKTIGFSLGFVINISIGTALGSLIPFVLFHSKNIFTLQGYMTIAGIFLIMMGVIFSYIAGLKRDTGEQHTVSHHYYLGVLYAIIAGLFSAGQNITFSMTAPLQQQALQLGLNHLVSANMIWPLFLIATFIPYSAYMQYLNYKNKNTAPTFRSLSYYSATFIMGTFWFFSLILYSVASLKIGDLGPVIGWPLFMVCIILTANMWGWRHGEWINASRQAKQFSKWSVAILILAILVLACAALGK